MRPRSADSTGFLGLRPRQGDLEGAARRLAVSLLHPPAVAFNDGLDDRQAEPQVAAAGMIVGMRVSLSIMLGAVTCWMMFVPWLQSSVPAVTSVRVSASA